jgi:hypothetical protein
LTEVKVKLTLLGQGSKVVELTALVGSRAILFIAAVATNGELELADVSMSSRPVSFPFNTLSVGVQPN